MYDIKPDLYDDKPDLYDDMTDLYDDMTDLYDDMTDLYACPWHVWLLVLWGGDEKEDTTHSSKRGSRDYEQQLGAIWASSPVVGRRGVCKSYLEYRNKSSES